MRKKTMLLGVIMLVAPLNSWGKALEDRDWIEVRTANFQIRSVMNEKKTLDLARHLEMFRVAVQLLTNISSTTSPIPTRIYALDSRADLKTIGLDGANIAGIFTRGLRYNTIVIRNSRADENSTILHEYVHFLIRNHAGLQYPKWYDEGFAEYLSGVRTNRANFEIGIVPKDRGGSLRYSTWIPISKILSPTNYANWPREGKAMFYAEAWALVHYMHNRPGQKRSFTEDMTHYLASIESGTPEIQAFEQAFELTTQRLDRDVRRYLKRGRFPFYKIATENLLADFSPEVSVLSRERIALGLAQLALNFRELDRADDWFTIAASDEATRPRAEAGRGDVRKFREEFDVALPYFESALALAPEDPYGQLDMAEYWHDRAKATEDHSERADFLQRTREHYVAAWKLDSNMPELYAMYGHTFLLDGSSYEKAIEMLEEAIYLLPSAIGVRLWLAEAYAGAQRTDDAIKAANYVLAWAHTDSEAAKKARILLDELNPSEPSG